MRPVDGREERYLWVALSMGFAALLGTVACQDPPPASYSPVPLRTARCAGCEREDLVRAECGGQRITQFAICADRVRNAYDSQNKGR